MLCHCSIWKHNHLLLWCILLFALACTAIDAQNRGVLLLRLVTFAPFHQELEAGSHVVDSTNWWTSKSTFMLSCFILHTIRIIFFCSQQTRNLKSHKPFSAYSISAIIFRRIHLNFVIDSFICKIETTKYSKFHWYQIQWHHALCEVICLDTLKVAWHLLFPQNMISGKHYSDNRKWLTHQWWYSYVMPNEIMG